MVIESDFFVYSEGFSWNWYTYMGESAKLKIIFTYATSSSANLNFCYNNFSHFVPQENTGMSPKSFQRVELQLMRVTVTSSSLVSSQSI